MVPGNIWKSELIMHQRKADFWEQKHFLILFLLFCRLRAGLQMQMIKSESAFHFVSHYLDVWKRNLQSFQVDSGSWWEIKSVNHVPVKVVVNYLSWFLNICVLIKREKLQEGERCNKRKRCCCGAGFTYHPAADHHTFKLILQSAS